MTDLNTPDDWWNEGFDDFFDGAALIEMWQLDGMARLGWSRGWTAANAYRHALRGQTDDD